MCSVADLQQLRFPKPIYLADGTALVTLCDAANWIIDHQPVSEAAIERLIDASEKGPDWRSAEIPSKP